jgi:hypothetical protein
MGTVGTSLSSGALGELRQAYDRLLSSVLEAANALRSGDRSAPARFAACRKQILQRLAFDGDGILSALDAHGADTTRLRSDHAAVKALLEAAQRELEGGTVAEFCEVAQELLVTLAAYGIRAARLARPK